MRQLIARIDDELHARVKAKAAAEGRTMNEVVIRALEGATADRLSESERVLRVLADSRHAAAPSPAPVGPVPTLDELLERNRGSGPALSDALQDERDSLPVVTVYADTSALARAYLADEAGHHQLRRQLLDDPGVRLLSRLTALEMAAAAHRAAQVGRLDAAGDLVRRFDADCTKGGPLRVVETDLGALEPRARRLLAAHPTLRTLDAIQVAVALRLAEVGVPDLVVVTRDDRQSAAARAEGLSVDDGA